MNARGNFTLALHQLRDQLNAINDVVIDAAKKSIFNEYVKLINTFLSGEMDGSRLVDLTTVLEKLRLHHQDIEKIRWDQIEAAILAVYREMQTLVSETDYIYVDKQKHPGFWNGVKRISSVGLSNYRFGNLTNMAMGRVTGTTAKLMPFSHNNAKKA